MCVSNISFQMNSKYQYYISVHIISVNLCQYSDIYCSETLHSLYTVWI